MRIAQYTNTYLPNINGVSRSVEIFREALTALGYEIAVFAPDDGGSPEDDPCIHRYPAFEVKKFNYSFSLPVSRTADLALVHFAPNVIHSHHPVWLGDIAAIKAEEMDLPLVFTFHTRYTEYSHYVPISQTITREAILWKLTRYLRRCHHIVTPSDSITEMLAEQGITSQVTTIPTGIDLVPFRLADGTALRSLYGWESKKVLVSVGRLAEEKNWMTMLDACARVMYEDRDVRLLLVGDGPQREQLEAHTIELGLNRKVKFVGKVPFEQVPAHLKVGDLFCYASTTETQGLVTLEAMAAGLPVVAVDATGTRDVVVDGVNGWLTENSSLALAMGIKKILDGAGLRKHFADKNTEQIQRYDIRLLAQRLVEVYKQAEEDQAAGRTIQVEKLTHT